MTAEPPGSRRPWIDPAIEEQIERAIESVPTDLTEAWRSLEEDLERHVEYHDHRVVNLNPAANVPGPRVSRLLGSTIGSRPSLGQPGAKYETGLRYADHLEVMAIALLRRVTGARYVEHRVGSGALANLYAYLATTEPGDRIMALPAAAGGHATHHAEGAAGLRGLEVYDIPVDPATMAIDLERTRDGARTLSPRLIVLGGSLVLGTQPVASMRDIADEVGATLLFDAAHLCGVILGGSYPHPLAEGAHLMTSSTYKSFGGPPGGFVATDDAATAERLDSIAYPGLTANFDLARTVALAAATIDFLAFGRDYARAMVSNAEALAEGLARREVPVVMGAGDRPTATHHVAFDAADRGGGDATARLLERADLLVSGIGLPGRPGDLPGVRLGTPEVTRWGMGPDHMDAVAGLVSRTLSGEDPEAVASDVRELRSTFRELHYCHPLTTGA